jgi:hypothetical protein
MSTPKVKLSLQPVPKSLVRVSVAGEFLKNMGLTDENEIRNIQQAVAEGLVSELMVLGVNSANIGKERFILRFDPLGRDDTISLDLSNGKSTTEALDTGFAGAVAYSVQLLKRRALSPRFYIIWSAQALADKNELAAACRRLGLTMDAGQQPAFSPDTMPPALIDMPRVPTAPSYDSEPSFMPPTVARYLASLPPAASGYTYKPVLSITPAKGTGISYRIESATRKK